LHLAVDRDRALDSSRERRVGDEIVPKVFTVQRLSRGSLRECSSKQRSAVNEDFDRLCTDTDGPGAAFERQSFLR
jgi:hypothetical protein